MKTRLYISTHIVTPSEQVDQVWHLHLTYTRSYWDEFCPNVLGQPFLAIETVTEGDRSRLKTLPLTLPRLALGSLIKLLINRIRCGLHKLSEN
jgi:hypothetical protein